MSLGKLGGETFYQQKWNSASSLCKSKTSHLNSHNTGEFTSGAKMSCPNALPGYSEMEICTGIYNFATHITSPTGHDSFNRHTGDINYNVRWTDKQFEAGLPPQLKDGPCGFVVCNSGNGWTRTGVKSKNAGSIHPLGDGIRQSKHKKTGPTVLGQSVFNPLCFVD